MKNVFFALLACLLTACFRVPQPSAFSIPTPATPASATAEPFSPDREAYSQGGGLVDNMRAIQSVRAGRRTAVTSR